MVMKMVTKLITKNDAEYGENAGFPGMDIKTDFKCVCGKVYSYSSGLSRHKKICSSISHNIISIDNLLDDTKNLLDNDSKIISVNKGFTDIKNLIYKQNKYYLLINLSKKQHESSYLKKTNLLDRIIVNNTHTKSDYDILKEVNVMRNIISECNFKNNTHIIFELI